MAEIKEVQLKLTSDSKGLEDGVKRSGLAFTELNSKVQLAEKAFSALQSAFGILSNTISRGQGVSELSAAFTSLGGTSKQLDTLRVSVQGLVSDTDLMRASNEALLAGLTPEQFERVAKAADSLGDAVGVNTKDAMDQLTRAVNTGNERLLKQYGIVVDNKKAEEDFAKQIGISADRLNEAGKKEAARIAILDKMEAQAKRTGEAHVTAGDGVQKMSAAFNNLLDKVAQGVNENTALANSLNHVATELAGIDPDPFVRGLTGMVSLLGQAIGLVDDFARGLEILQNKTANAQIFNIDNRINKLSANSSGPFDKAFNAFEIPRLQAQKQAIIDNYRAVEDFKQNLAQLPALYDQATHGVLDFTGKLKYERDAFVDTSKAAEDYKNKLDAIATAHDGAYTAGFFFGNEYDESYVKKLEDGFQQSVDFFSDIFTPMLEGQAANFEDIFKDAAKRIAIGFASQMAASLALKLGFDVSSIGSAGGLGGALATSLGFGGGGSKGLGEILSGTSTAASGASLLGSGTASADFIGPMQPGVSTLGATVGIVAAIAGGAALFAQAVAQFEKSNKDYTDATKAGAQTYFAGDVTGISQTYFAAMAAFGGSQDPDTLRRRDLRGALQKTGLGDDLTFDGVNGKTSIFDSGYNQDLSNPQNAGAISLANPLATLFSGGDDVGGQQLAAMFADATDNAENYNEVLINTQALMEGLGINADEAKQGLEDLFLDGKISLDEFSSGITNLNILAQDNLVGTGSVSDAIGILDNELASPRVKLKALELGFKEMSEIGIDTTSEIHDYLTSHFSPDVVAVFDKLAAAGIDTFEEIANATPEQIAIIFDAMKDLASHADDAFSDVGDAIERNVKRGVSGAKKELASLADAARRTGRDVEAAGGSGQNPNQRLNGRPA